MMKNLDKNPVIAIPGLSLRERVQDCIDERIVEFCTEKEVSITDFYENYFHRIENLKRITIDHKDYDAHLRVRAYKGVLRYYGDEP